MCFIASKCPLLPSLPFSPFSSTVHPSSFPLFSFSLLGRRLLCTGDERNPLSHSIELLINLHYWDYKGMTSILLSSSSEPLPETALQEPLLILYSIGSVYNFSGGCVFILKWLKSNLFGRIRIHFPLRTVRPHME